MGKWRRNLSLPRRWQRNHLISKYGPGICGGCDVGIPPTPEPQQYFKQLPTERLKVQKCDVCGSTAIDHTEAACQQNRGFAFMRTPDLAQASPSSPKKRKP